MLTVLQIGRRPIPQRNHIIYCRRAMNSRLMNATHVLFDRGLIPAQAKPSGKVSVVTTTLTNGRIESHHHKHLHLQPAWLVPWITLCPPRDLLCSALQLVPNSAVGCSTSFRPKTFSFGKPSPLQSKRLKEVSGIDREIGPPLQSNQRIGTRQTKWSPRGPTQPTRTQQPRTRRDPVPQHDNLRSR
jgi:hypothetical protein